MWDVGGTCEARAIQVRVFLLSGHGQVEDKREESDIRATE